MKLTRAQRIDKGMIWRVHPDNDLEHLLFEGSKTACAKYLRTNNLMRAWRKGVIRIGKLLWEEL